jgi:hypothetical protein
MNLPSSDEVIALGGLVVAISLVWNKLRVRRKLNVAERRKADDAIQEDMNAAALAKARTLSCRSCGEKTFPSALDGVCATCWYDGTWLKIRKNGR